MAFKGIKREGAEHISKRVQNSEPIEYTYMSRTIIIYRPEKNRVLKNECLRQREKSKMSPYFLT